MEFNFGAKVQILLLEKRLNDDFIKIGCCYWVGIRRRKGVEKKYINGIFALKQ